MDRRNEGISQEASQPQEERRKGLPSSAGSVRTNYCTMNRGIAKMEQYQWRQ